jgi:CBS domain-containing protein
MNANLVIAPQATLREALEAITKNVRQAVLVTETGGRLLGLGTRRGRVPEPEYP